MAELLKREGYETIAATAFAAQKQTAEYVCPMHAEVKSSKPGKCPKCEMALRKVDDAPSAAAKAKPVEKDESQSASIKIPDVTVLDQDSRKLRARNPYEGYQRSRRQNCGGKARVEGEKKAKTPAESAAAGIS